jgi:5-methylcytosine-specific restriction protein A
MYLARNPFCRVCEQEGRTELADVIHHITPLADGGAKYDERNLMPICSQHHRELHGFGGNRNGSTGK